MSADWGSADVWGQLWVKLNHIDMESKPKHMLTPGLRNWGKISWDTLDIIHRGNSRAAVGCYSNGGPSDSIKLRTEPGWLGELAEPQVMVPSITEPSWAAICCCWPLWNTQQLRLLKSTSSCLPFATHFTTGVSKPTRHLRVLINPISK